MGKSSGVVVAILGLLIGIGGLGFGVYSYFTFSGKIANLNEQMDGKIVKGMWYAESLTDWTPSAINTNESITGLTINFVLNEGESVYFSFISRAIIYAYSGQTYMRFTFRIDGIILDAPFTVAGGYGIDETFLYIPVALQYSTDILAAGNHTVSVIALKSYALNFIRHSTLIVQTYVF
ncbi:MAG: hypothetical protein ACFFB0_20515 [Promethearchaeota archaeon]